MTEIDKFSKYETVTADDYAFLEMNFFMNFMFVCIIVKSNEFNNNRYIKDGII